MNCCAIRSGVSAGRPHDRVCVHGYFRRQQAQVDDAAAVLQRTQRAVRDAEHRAVRERGRCDVRLAELDHERLWLAERGDLVEQAEPSLFDRDRVGIVRRIAAVPSEALEEVELEPVRTRLVEQCPEAVDQRSPGGPRTGVEDRRVEALLVVRESGPAFADTPATGVR